MCAVCDHIARLKVIVIDQVLSLLKPLSMQVALLVVNCANTTVGDGCVVYASNGVADMYFCVFAFHSSKAHQ